MAAEAQCPQWANSSHSGAAWDGDSWTPWEPARGLAPHSGGGVCSKGCPTGRKGGKSCISVAQDSGSQSFRSTQVSYSPTEQGGLCRQLGQGTLGSDLIPTADSTGTTRSPPCPHPPPPGDPGPGHSFPMQPHPMTPVRWLMPSTTLDAPTEAAETYGVHGARRVGHSSSQAASLSCRGAQPGNFPRAGQTLVSLSAKPHPESLPASCRGGASAGILCPTPVSAQ